MIKLNIEIETIDAAAAATKTRIHHSGSTSAVNLETQAYLMHNPKNAPRTYQMQIEVPYLHSFQCILDIKHKPRLRRVPIEVPNFSHCSHILH